jgi:glutamyl-tRNA reductase
MKTRVQGVEISAFEAAAHKNRGVGTWLKRLFDAAISVAQSQRVTYQIHKKG